jgi:prepilin-type N-terminal cleavage/methylation domain-containing protein
MQPGRGFSMVELLTVIVIILVVSAIATPNVLRAIRTYRLTAASRDVANLLLRARFEAVRLNRQNPPLLVRTQVVGGRDLFWIDLNSNGNAEATESQVLLPSEIRSMAPGGAAPNTASMGLGATTQLTAAVAFNPRGVLEFGVAAPTTFVVILGYAAQPDIGFRAITITPLARSQTWRAPLNGTWMRQ